MILNEFLLTAGITVAALLIVAAKLHLLPRLGAPGRWSAERMCRAPMLDLIVTYFTILPLVVGPIVYGWIGLAGAIVGQIVAVHVWVVAHELTHPAGRRGPRIIKVLNRIVGPVRNYTAVWVTAVVVPMFWIVRLAELTVYPWLILLVRFPRYNQGEWVNVSRQKFSGLIGHDLIWCLYCDWMTGVWSLGSEMLRNVESFWCPIRFRSDKKCDNCRHDFPDVNTTWIAADGSMDDVAKLLQSQYERGSTNAWHGKTVELTVKRERS